jgi:hypothetical protein
VCYSLWYNAPTMLLGTKLFLTSKRVEKEIRVVISSGRWRQWGPPKILVNFCQTVRDCRLLSRCEALLF